MASIPNLNTLRSGRSGPRRRAGGRVNPQSDGYGGVEGVPGASAETVKDEIVQRTDNDAASSRMSAVAVGYLDDVYANIFHPPGREVPRRYPIINRGTYVRTKAIDTLVQRFLTTQPKQKKQIVSLGAGSDTRFFRMVSRSDLSECSTLHYHELDFETNVSPKRTVLRSSPMLSNVVQKASNNGWRYHLHALDIRDLTKKSPPMIPELDIECPTLLLSECCLCYLPPEIATSVVQYFTMHMSDQLALVLYEPIRPFDAFGKTMVSNLASRGIHLQTLRQYGTLEAQRRRLQMAGFTTGQGARDVRELWEAPSWIGEAEMERVERLEWLDEVEEWNLLSSHYCVAWGWRGDVFEEAWRDLDGSKTPTEANDEAQDR